MTHLMAQNGTMDAFLDAAGRLSICVGYTGLSARGLAEALLFQLDRAVVRTLHETADRAPTGDVYG